uniref:FBA_2 domain-containing protein n=2 Tax=Caenorhabditis tropicalis TaxID=1561998 RepID=A0A1I7UIM9_9PELO
MVPMSIELRDYGYLTSFYFEDEIEGLKMVTEYFCSFFETPIIDDATLTFFSIPNQAVIITDWLFQRQKSVRWYQIEILNANDTVARNLLDKCRFASSIMFCMVVSPEFKYDFEFKKDGKVYIDFGSWFTLENLLNVNCEHLTLFKTPLTNMDINLFIKHWMTSDLKFHSVKIYPKEVLNLDVIVSEIPVVRRERRDCFDVTNNKIVTIFNGLEVKQNDGLKTATISINDDPLNEFGRFWMIVWDTL